MYSDNDLKQLSLYAYENAKNLLDEAVILFEHNKFARSFALAHLASEELGKLPIIHNIRLNLKLKRVVDIKDFNKKLGGHQPKLGKIFFFDYINSDNDLINDSDLKEYEQNMKNIKEHDKNKNTALYSGFLENKPYLPSAVITESDAFDSVSKTRIRLGLFETRWRGMINSEISQSQLDFYLKAEKAFNIQN